MLDAIRRAEGVAYRREPLEEMERAAIEPLPGLDDFLPGWRALLEKEVAREGVHGWGGDRRSWLREVAGRLEGTAGLANLARSSGIAEDYRGWCARLVKAKDWAGALAAFEEAADRIADPYSRGSFLDGAAQCAQELGRRDVPVRLERAWRADPDLLRLARWLGAAGSRASLRKWALLALDSCPKKHERQRAFLHVLSGDLSSAAKLLASAPGLGWSAEEHPGHLLFPLFQALLRGSSFSPASLEFPHAVTALADMEGAFDPLDADEDADEDADGDADEVTGEEDLGEAPRLAAPTLPELLSRAGVRGVTDVATRRTVVVAMKKAVEKRLAGVTGNQRRRHYGHAAELVAAVVESDPHRANAGWVREIRETYRRYPALQSALDHHVGRG